jgi:hypothetical protein
MKRFCLFLMVLAVGGCFRPGEQTLRPEAMAKKPYVRRVTADMLTPDNCRKLIDQVEEDLTRETEN